MTGGGSGPWRSGWGCTREVNRAPLSFEDWVPRFWILEQAPKKLINLFDKYLLQLFCFERRLSTK
jgi:hypothetical protein